MLTEAESNIKILSGALALLQSTAWIIMALICIVFYHTDNILVEPKTYSDQIGNLLFQRFLTNNEKTFNGQIFTGDVFDGFMFIYLFLDIIWIGFSFQMLRDKQLKVPRIYEYWGYFTLFISFWDFITFVMLGADYDKCLSTFEEYRNILDADTILSFEAGCANTILPAFIIAARGFVLWIINIALGVFALRTCYRLKKEGKSVATAYH